MACTEFKTALQLIITVQMLFDYSQIVFHITQIAYFAGDEGKLFIISRQYFMNCDKVVEFDSRDVRWPMLYALLPFGWMCGFNY